MIRYTCDTKDQKCQISQKHTTLIFSSPIIFLFYFFYITKFYCSHFGVFTKVHQEITFLYIICHCEGFCTKWESVSTMKLFLAVSGKQSDHYAFKNALILKTCTDIHCDKHITKKVRLKRKQLSE